MLVGILCCFGVMFVAVRRRKKRHRVQLQRLERGDSPGAVGLHVGGDVFVVDLVARSEERVPRGIDSAPWGNKPTVPGRKLKKKEFGPRMLGGEPHNGKARAGQRLAMSAGLLAQERGSACLLDVDQGGTNGMQGRLLAVRKSKSCTQLYKLDEGCLAATAEEAKAVESEWVLAGTISAPFHAVVGRRGTRPGAPLRGTVVDAPSLQLHTKGPIGDLSTRSRSLFGTTLQQANPMHVGQGQANPISGSAGRIARSRSDRRASLLVDTNKWSATARKAALKKRRVEFNPMLVK